jgi:predicted metalloprotease with PDZ domain
MLNLLTALAIASAPPTTSIDTIRYEIGFARDDSAKRVLDIRVRFRATQNGRTPVELPHSWAGHSDLEKQVSSLRLIGDRSAALVDGDSSFLKTVNSRPGAPLELRYRLRQDWSGPLRRPEYFRAAIGDGYALLVGQNALVHPAHPDGDSLFVEFVWRDKPAKWIVSTSFGEGSAQRTRTTIEDLLESVFVAGEFRAYAAYTYGSPVRILVRGNWTFSDSALAAATQNVVGRERLFWRDRSARRYVVAVVPSAGGIGGTAYTNALVMYADTTSRLSTFAGLLAHETFHQWNGHTIRTAGPEGGMKWLSEGFTEYFADRFAREAGFLSNDEYVAKVNDAIRHYYTSPVRNATREDLNRRYWSDPDMNRFPYYQGYLVAGFLDGVLRSATRNRFTIDSVMFALYRSVRASGRKVDDTLFASAAPASVRGAVRDSVASFVAAGNTVPVTRSSFGGCIDVKSEAMYRFDLGFDVSASTRDRVVSGVRPGSMADSAGIQNGMRLRGWSWFNGDPRRNASIRITDGDSVRTISWTPRGDTAIEVPQISAQTRCSR